MLLAGRPAKAEPTRIMGLDMLRALAVFLVIGHHTAWRFRPQAGDFFGQIFKGSGWIGVDVFFVISGFMITTILLRDADDIRGFFVRRFYRIVPIFSVAIATLVLVTLATGIGVDKLRWVWSPALFLNGWTLPFIGYGEVPYTIAWSLSVEETAYILLGLACVLHARGIRNALLAFLVVAPLVRLAVLAQHWFNPADLYFFVPARLDSIALGGLAALAAGKLRFRAWHPVAAGLAVACFIWAFQYLNIGDWRLIVLGYPAFGFVMAVLVAGIADLESRAPVRDPVGASPARRALETVLHWTAPAQRAIAYFGKLSYFIYLFHVFVLEALLHGLRLLHVTVGFWQALALATVIVFCMAWVSWNYFEYPLIRRGRNRSSAPLRTPAHASINAPT